MSIFVDEINYLIDMIVFVSILVLIIFAILLLKGEGNSYGSDPTGNEKNNIGISK